MISRGYLPLKIEQKENIVNVKYSFYGYPANSKLMFNVRIKF